MNVSSDSAHRLRELIAQATTKYSVKDYDAAAELYSHATELQAEINGEMSSKNADLLYAYGRCLYHVAVKNSDVLGSKLSGENREEGFRKPVRKDSDMRTLADEADDENTRVAEEVMTNIVKENGTDTIAAVNPSKEYKPYFQFAGDENFDTGDEDEETNIEQLEEETGEGSAEDDFVNAYEMLDLARVLTLKQLKETETLNGVIEKGNTETVQQLKERLADTHDLQAEISLESEKFPSAVVDLKFALNLKRSLFSQDSSLLAEAHYKLSLALEFASITQQKDGCGEFETGKEAHIDDEMREEAAREMEAAIASCKLRIEKEEAKHPSASELYTDTGKPKKTKQDIDDVKDMVNEMEQRLAELRQPPVSIIDPRSTGTLNGPDPLDGILRSLLGKSPAAQKAGLDEASKGANDLTNLVKKKKRIDIELQGSPDCRPAQANGKRKIELAGETEEEEVATGKKMKISKD